MPHKPLQLTLDLAFLEPDTLKFCVPQAWTKRLGLGMEGRVIQNSKLVVVSVDVAEILENFQLRLSWGEGPRQNSLMRFYPGPVNHNVFLASFYPGRRKVIPVEISVLERGK